MVRGILIVVMASAMALSVQAQTVEPDPEEEVNAADYIRGELSKTDRADFRNPAPLPGPGNDPEIGGTSAFQSPTVFEGRRSHSLRGTGLNVLPYRPLNDVHP